jgi:hypothetical protein
MVHFKGAISSYEKRIRGVFLTPENLPTGSEGIRRSGRIEINPRRAP